MKKYMKSALYGFIAWLVPFLAAFLFYSREGKLNIDVLFFKSIMVVVGSATAAFLLISYFKKINADYFKEGIRVGVVWFAVNVLLDLLILLPMSGMAIPNYFMQIGLGYLAIPAMSVSVGAVLASKK